MTAVNSLLNGNATPLLINGDGRAYVHKVGLGGRVDSSGTPNESNAPEGRCSTCLRRVSGGIVGWLENSFYRLGKLVARNPWRCLVICVIVCGVAGIGMTKWHEENECGYPGIPGCTKNTNDKCYTRHLFTCQKLRHHQQQFIVRNMYKNWPDNSLIVLCIVTPFT
ncbi:hypothetical protein DPMN_092708 [Dreissena polymorpha]|uniref:Uncharacterized protein n=1 Tax=Dreissena polymorpha TaxID=45954 RepID=A0A9D4L2N5_DREPO|nr:hypothetical protein DPMN_092708 [Dreissena polymorpha]